jgi:hypothetical protein
LEGAQNVSAFKALWETNKPGWKEHLCETDYARVVAAMKRAYIKWVPSPSNNEIKERA